MLLDEVVVVVLAAAATAVPVWTTTLLALSVLARRSPHTLLSSSFFLVFPNMVAVYCARFLLRLFEQAIWQQGLVAHASCAVPFLPRVYVCVFRHCLFVPVCCFFFVEGKNLGNSKVDGQT